MILSLFNYSVVIFTFRLLPFRFHPKILTFALHLTLFAAVSMIYGKI